MAVQMVVQRVVKLVDWLVVSSAASLVVRMAGMKDVWMVVKMAER